MAVPYQYYWDIAVSPPVTLEHGSAPTSNNGTWQSPPTSYIGKWQSPPATSYIGTWQTPYQQHLAMAIHSPVTLEHGSPPDQ